MPEALGSIEFTWQLYATFFLAYLIGSIPFGLITTKLGGLGDIRNQGSGNIGATNVLRTGNKKLAGLTLILDILKGIVPVIIAHYIFSRDHQILAGAGAILGHMLPLWIIVNKKINTLCAFRELLIITFGLVILLNGKGFINSLGAILLLLSTLFAWGGKGVATSLGVMLIINPILGIFLCIVWIISIIIFRYSSVAALISFFFAPILIHLLLKFNSYSYLKVDYQLFEFTLFVSLAIWIRHIENISRLFKGLETKIGTKAKN